MRSTKTKRHSVYELAEEKDINGIGTIDHNLDEMWSAEIELNGHSTKFKLDTGASVSVIKKNGPWLKGQSLERSKKILHGPGGVILSPRGTLNVELKYHDRTINETVYILDNQPCSLLSRKACIELGIIKRIDSVIAVSSKPEPSNSKVKDSSLSPKFKEQFPNLFTGLGKVKMEYKIKLADNAKSIRIYAPRRVAHPLLSKVKAEL